MAERDIFVSIRLSKQNNGIHFNPIYNNRMSVAYLLRCMSDDLKWHTFICSDRQKQPIKNVEAQQLQLKLNLETQICQNK